MCIRDSYSNNLNAALDEQTSDFIYELEHIRMQDRDVYKRQGAYCRYFREAVLPLDPALEAALLAEGPRPDFKACPVCGRACLLYTSRCV